MNTETALNITVPVVTNRQLRIVPRDDGEQWFVARDAAEGIGVTWRGNETLEGLDDDEKGVVLIDTPGGKQEMLIVSEPGLYKLILRSREAVIPGTFAHAFTRKITHEILPCLHKYGCYPPPPSSEALPLTFPEHLYIEGIPARSIADIFSQNTVRCGGNTLRISTLKPIFNQAIPSVYWSTRRLHRHLSSINLPVSIDRQRCPVLQGFALVA